MKNNGKMIVIKNTETGQTFVDAKTAYKAVKVAKAKGALTVGYAIIAIGVVGVVGNKIAFSIKKKDDN